MGWIVKCSVCGEAIAVKQANRPRCEKHHRFGKMRSTARRDNKAVPTMDELESMSGSSLVCPDCGVKMNWLARDGKSTVASLQHYRNGTMEIVCLSCNTRHASMVGDSYKSMPKDHKKCPCCEQIKPLVEFTLDSSRSGPAKRKSKCRKCSDDSVNQWRKENRDKNNEYQRKYRAKRKAEGNPIRRGR